MEVLGTFFTAPWGGKAGCTHSQVRSLHHPQPLHPKLKALARKQRPPTMPRHPGLASQGPARVSEPPLNLTLPAGEVGREGGRADLPRQYI